MKCSLVVDHLWEAEEIETLPFVITCTRQQTPYGIVVNLNIDDEALKQFNNLLRRVNDGMSD